VQGQPKFSPPALHRSSSSHASTPTSPTIHVPGWPPAGSLPPVPGTSAMRKGLRRPSAQTRLALLAGSPSKNGLLGRPSPVSGSRRRILPARLRRSWLRRAPLSCTLGIGPRSSVAGWTKLSKPGSSRPPVSVWSQCAPSPIENSSVPSGAKRNVPLLWLLCRLATPSGTEPSGSSLPSSTCRLSMSATMLPSSVMAR
jgi:hypothetical protein